MYDVGVEEGEAKSKFCMTIFFSIKHTINGLMVDGESPEAELTRVDRNFLIYFHC